MAARVSGACGNRRWEVSDICGSSEQSTVPVMVFITAGQIFPAHVHVLDQRTMIEQDARHTEQQHEQRHAEP